jgi:hypothetical protein
VQEEINALVMEGLQDAQQIGQGASQAIDRPTGYHVELLGVDGLEEGVEARPLIPAFGSRYAGVLIDLDDLPAGTLGNDAKLTALVRFAFARASRARENSPGASVSALFSYWFKAIANENISMPTRTLGDVRIVTGSGRDHIMYHKARSVGSQHYALHGTRPDA